MWSYLYPLYISLATCVGVSLRVCVTPSSQHLRSGGEFLQRKKHVFLIFPYTFMRHFCIFFFFFLQKRRKGFLRAGSKNGGRRGEQRRDKKKREYSPCRCQNQSCLVSQAARFVRTNMKDLTELTSLTFVLVFLCPSDNARSFHFSYCTANTKTDHTTNVYTAITPRG